jgi:calcineurin-like phosphoesterase
MTGPHDSVLGRKKEKVLSVLVTGMPTYFDVAAGDLRVCGAVVTADTQTGRATAIERIAVPVSQEDLARKAAEDEAAAKESVPEPPETGDSLECP